MKKRIFIALAIIFSGACAFLFNIFYNDAKKTAIMDLNEQQTIHAKLAALGIEDFFANWTQSLISLSKMDDVIDTDAVGKRVMNLFYEAHQEQIKSITRLDERGVVAYNFPVDSYTGTDISAQKHVGELLRDHRPVISDVFRAIEGFDAVALHAPIFRGSVFKGSIGILIDFESLTKRYLDVIKIDETGYSWVISRDGIILYSPISGLTGKSVFETIRDFPSDNVMVNDMLKGHEGTAIYTFDRIGDQNVGQIRKYAVYMPIQLGNTFWSIVVASAEQEVLSGLISFRNKLLFVIGALFVFGMVFSTLGAKAFLIIKEQEKRNQAEGALRESEERMSAITFSMADWVWEVDENGIYTYSSEKGENILGRSREDIIGMTPFDFMLPDEVTRVAAIFSEATANNAPVKDLENRKIRKNGEKVSLLTNCVPILDKEGNHKGYRGVDRDISERLKAEAEARQRRDELAHVTRIAMMGELTTSLAHEINQPLTAILTNAEAAKRFLSRAAPDISEVRQIMDDIIRDDRRASDIVRKVRALVKKEKPVIEQLDMNEVIQGGIDLIRGDFLLQGFSIETELISGLATINGDSIQLQQVLLNLILNGADATRNSAAARRRIIVRTVMADDRTVKVSVTDFGTGIDERYIDHLFEPFYTTKSEGLGMGLSISQAIINSHGGTMDAWNNREGGATFAFMLPAHQGDLP